MKLKNSLAITLLLSSSVMFASEVPADLATAHQPAAIVTMTSALDIPLVSATDAVSVSVEDRKREELQAAVAVVAAHLSPEILFSLVGKFIETQIDSEDREAVGAIFQDAGKRMELLMAKHLRKQNLNDKLHQEGGFVAEDVKEEAIEVLQDASKDVSKPSATLFEVVAADAQSDATPVVSLATELEKAAEATEQEPKN